MGTDMEALDLQACLDGLDGLTDEEGALYEHEMLLDDVKDVEAFENSFAEGVCRDTGSPEGVASQCQSEETGDKAVSAINVFSILSMFTSFGAVQNGLDEKQSDNKWVQLFSMLYFGALEQADQL